MKKSMRKLVTGTLICAMAATASPVTNFGFLGEVAQVKANTDYGYSVSVYGNDITRYGNISLMKGFPTQLEMDIENGAETPKFTYTIEDTSIVSIDAEGKITPNEVGETKIVVKEEETGFTKEMKVSVLEHFVCGGMSFEPMENGRFRFTCASEYAGVTRVSIPYSINGAVISVIGERACADFDNVRVISVPNETETIESEAFADNDSLEYVMIPSSVTTIADDIFGTEPLEKKITLLGHEGSEAEKFALAHEDQVIFKAIDKELKNYNFLWEMSFENVNGTINMLVGDSQQLEVNLQPEYTSEAIYYSSSDEEVVTVTEDGMMKAVGAGKAVVKVESENGVKLLADVVVGKKAEETTPSVTTGAAVTTTPAVTSTPAVATTPAITSGPEITVEPVTGGAVDTTKSEKDKKPVIHPVISAEPNEDKEKSLPTATPTVYYVAQEEKDIPLPTFNAIIEPQDTETTIPTIAIALATSTPAEATKAPVAEVEKATQDPTGNSMVTKAGNIAAATIEKMATTEGAAKETSSANGTEITTSDNTVQKKTKKEVEVNFESTPSIKITTKKSKKMVVGKKYTIKAKISSDKKIKWMVSNEKIATINKKTGVLKAKKAGKVTVFAICDGAKEKITFTIKK